MRKVEGFTFCGPAAEHTLEVLGLGLDPALDEGSGIASKLVQEGALDVGVV